MNEQLRTIFADTLGVDSSAVTPAFARESEAAWDSLNHLRLITAVEEAFAVKLSMSEIQNIKSAGELQECLSAHGVVP